MISLLGLLILWVLVALAVDLHTLFLPSPHGVLLALLESARDGTVFTHIGATLLRVCFAVGIGAILGTPIGFLCGTQPAMRRHFLPLVDFLRAIPTSLLFPVFIVFLGFGESAKGAIALYATIPVFIVSVFAGTLPRKDTAGRYEYLQVHSDRIPRNIQTVNRLWDALPSLLSGTRLAVGTALVLVIVTEMFFVASSGVGWAAYQAYLAFNLDRMYMFILLIGVLGYSFNRIVDHALRLEQKQ